MKASYYHSWDVSPEEAVAIQLRLRKEVVKTDHLGMVRLVAGVDVGFEDEGRITRAAVVLLCFPELEIRESVLARLPTRFPYVPGLLSFREGPAVLQALEQLTEQPDLLVVDGHGIAHPRRFGIASHLGLLTGIPSIGAAKSILVGVHTPVTNVRGAWQPLVDGDEIIGAVLRTRPNTKPVFISTGHRISLETAIDLVLRCAPKYRLPEPTRQAHLLASQK